MMRKLIETEKGVLALVLLAANFAAMGLFIRFLSTGFSLLQQVYLRVFAALVLGYFIFYKDINISKIKKISPKEWLILFTRGVGGYLIAVTLYSLAIIKAKYSNVSFISALPVVAIYGAVLLKEKVSPKKLLLISTAFIGALLISVKDYAHIFSWGSGEVYALLSTLVFGFTYIVRKWQSDLLNNKEISVVIFLLGFVAVFLASLLKGESLPLTGWNNQLFLAVLGAGLFNVTNLFLINYGFQKVEATLASNILTLESAFAVLFGFIFFKELPITKEILGGVLIVLSVIFMNKLELIENKSK